MAKKTHCFEIMSIMKDRLMGKVPTWEGRTTFDLKIGHFTFDGFVSTLVDEFDDQQYEIKITPIKGA